VYREVADRAGYVQKVIASEEEKFRGTLQSGLQRLEEQMEAAASTPEKTLSGDMVFMLHDTFGFPREITRDIAAERGISIDEGGFEAAMEQQRQRAREAAQFGAVMIVGGATALLELEKSVPATQFLAMTRWNPTRRARGPQERRAVLHSARGREDRACAGRDPLLRRDRRTGGGTRDWGLRIRDWEGPGGSEYWTPSKRPISPCI